MKIAIMYIQYRYVIPTDRNVSTLMREEMLAIRSLERESAPWFNRSIQFFVCHLREDTDSDNDVDACHLRVHRIYLYRPPTRL